MKKTKIFKVILFLFFVGFFCGATALASSASTTPPVGTGNNTGIIFQNPLGWSTLEEFFQGVLDNLMSLIALLAVLFIVIGGIMYILSGADPKLADRGKAMIRTAIIGFAIALGAKTFLVEIYRIFNIDSPGGLSLYDVIFNVLQLALSLLGILAILGMVIGGMFYFGYGVSEKSVDKGKNIIKNSLIGLLLALAAEIIVKEVAKLILGN